MPLHDWSRTTAGVYHCFHLAWLSELKRVVHAALPDETHYGLIEPSSWEGLDIVSPEALSEFDNSVVEDDFYATRRRRLAIFRAGDDKRCAFIEFAGPAECRLRQLPNIARFVASRLKIGHKVMLIDVASARTSETYNLLTEVFRSLEVAQDARLPDTPWFAASLMLEGCELKIYATALDVGRPLPQLPLYVDNDIVVNIPLEETYQRAFCGVPQHLQRHLEEKSVR